jgi:RNA polymerase sigma-70 factor (ECF subfamily)
LRKASPDFAPLPLRSFYAPAWQGGGQGLSGNIMMINQSAGHSGGLLRGSLSSSGRNLERYRDFLRLLAVAEISPALRRRLEPSDVVQQTMLEAFEKRAQFQGTTDCELAEWLRQMLRHNVKDAIRGLRCQKRDITRERPLGPAPGDSQAMRIDWVTACLSTPSQALTATEEMLQMSQAIAQLPKDQREAVVLHHLQGRTLAELARHFNRHPSAVAGLLHRGLKKLRANMNT